jgi:hypothetical protein
MTANVSELAGTGLIVSFRQSERLGLRWGDVNWRSGYRHVQRNIVRGRVTTPKNHQSRRVDCRISCASRYPCGVGSSDVSG